MTTTYTIDDLPVDPPRARRLRVGVDVGGYREVGVAYTLAGAGRPADVGARWPVDGLPSRSYRQEQGLAYRVRREGAEAYGMPPSGRGLRI